ncbi:MBL fold metallo-hydrolase [uncultured Winogradskyella sp.]|uniref:MBL fold metallo-hydrolase n=1 Tax=uncultured Winogradskyella sp. TaxID=395353 RepID=UPI002620C4EE|nr:MBL fold metallo-hydrolase [uncultured Winogradskyella sp.]
MKLSKTLLLLIISIVFACKNEKADESASVSKEEVVSDPSAKIIPITHGTLVIENEDEIIYIDPVGGLEAFKGQKPPTLVLITDIHGDHLSNSTLEALNLSDVTIIAPKAVTDKISSTTSKTIVTLNNNDSYKHNTINIEAIPMYNLRKEALKYHTKGRGNGYVLTINDQRIYISGDTEDIPEMRSLKNIDKAFVCMNLPYTMTVDSAASAVLDFKPQHVYPYHYRGTEGLSDIERFKKLVNDGDSSIKVVLLDWY